MVLTPVFASHLEIALFAPIVRNKAAIIPIDADSSSIATSNILRTL